MAFKCRYLLATAVALVHFASGASVKSCSELGWGPQLVCGSSGICAGECCPFLSRNDAEDRCRSLGARLCTVQELLDGRAQGTGCSLDRERIWAADICSAAGQALSAAGNGVYSVAPPSCVDINELLGVRCCADSDPTIDDAKPSPTVESISSPETSGRPLRSDSKHVRFIGYARWLSDPSNMAKELQNALMDRACYATFPGSRSIFIHQLIAGFVHNLPPDNDSGFAVMGKCERAACMGLKRSDSISGFSHLCVLDVQQRAWITAQQQATTQAAAFSDTGAVRRQWSAPPVITTVASGFGFPIFAPSYPALSPLPSVTSSGRAPSAANGRPCGGHSDCPSDHRCVTNVCRRLSDAPVTVAACFPTCSGGRTCTNGVCVEPAGPSELELIKNQIAAAKAEEERVREQLQALQQEEEERAKEEARQAELVKQLMEEVAGWPVSYNDDLLYDNCYAPAVRMTICIEDLTPDELAEIVPEDETETGPGTGSALTAAQATCAQWEFCELCAAAGCNWQVGRCSDACYLPMACYDMSTIDTCPAVDVLAKDEAAADGVSPSPVVGAPCTDGQVWCARRQTCLVPWRESC